MCYVIFLFRAGVIVRGSTRTFPAFLAMGLAYLLVFQGFFNMGVAVGIFPVTGQPLPLVSMGGTSVLFTCVALGAILSVSRNNMEEAQRLKAEAQQQEVSYS
jgi:cell division protein FtsW